MSEVTPPVEVGEELSESAEHNIEAWEKKRAAERSAQPGGDLSDDAESGGP